MEMAHTHTKRTGEPEVKSVQIIPSEEQREKKILKEKQWRNSEL